MPDPLLLLASANLLICWVVGVPLFFGMRRLARIETVEPAHDETLPKVSVIVAARNEERDIEHGMRSLMRLDYPGLEIIAVEDRSTDRTGEILDRIAAEDARLKVVHITELPAGWLGKNNALQHGADQAGGDLLLFTDADVVMEASVLRRSVSHLIRNEIDHLPMLFRIQMPNWLLESFVVTFTIYLMTYCRPWKCPDPNSAAHIGVGGFNLVRANVYREMGGHEAIRMRPDDDLKFGKLVKKHGFRQECVNAVELMYVPWYASIRELVVGLEKNAFSGVDYHLAYALMASFSMLAFNVFPFVALAIARGAAWWVDLAVVLSLLGMGADAARNGKSRISCCLGFPLAALMFVAIQWRTILLNFWHGGIRWRDTHYSLAELKANKV